MGKTERHPPPKVIAIAVRTPLLRAPAQVISNAQIFSSSNFIKA